MTAERSDEHAPKLLDLYSCAGGAGMGYHLAGFEVVGVDIAEQPNYPFEHVVADALEYLAEHGHEYDAIHASPPCQSFTAYRRKGRGVGDGYPDLIEPTRELLAPLDVPWVIENVAGAPLVNPARYCGSSFGLDVRRHRFFESNVLLTAPDCDHSWQTPRFPPATNRTNLRRTVEVGVWRIPLPVQQKAMGIDWMTLRSPCRPEASPFARLVGGDRMNESSAHEGERDVMVQAAAEALRTSRLSWGTHTDRWADQEWQSEFWTEAATIALTAAGVIPPAGEVRDV